MLTKDRSKLGRRLKQVREGAGFKTIRQLRTAIQKRGGQISAQFIGQVEGGKKRPTLETLTAILDACGVPVSSVLGKDSIIPEDASVLGVRIRSAREQAGYKTIGELWKAIEERGGGITRQFLYQLERGQQAASIEKLTLILDACEVTIQEFLATDLIIGPRDDANVDERKLVRMMTRIRKLNPALARVVEASVFRAYQEVQASKESKKDIGGGEGNHQ